VAEWSAVARRIRVPLGFVFAAVYVLLASPTWRSIVVGAIVCVPGLWLRGFASGHIRKNEQVTSGGPYAYTRNPLYLGSIVIAAGFAIAARSLVLAAVMAAIFLAVYLPVISSEEEFLRSRFPEYEAYVERVPRLLPRLRRSAPAPQARFSAALYWAHREYSALLGAGAMLGALTLKLLWFSR
jgi:protein-S-isoprenylcysteine O-methyltransferase Ste14